MGKSAAIFTKNGGNFQIASSFFVTFHLQTFQRMAENGPFPACQAALPIRPDPRFTLDSSILEDEEHAASQPAVLYFPKLKQILLVVVASSSRLPRVASWHHILKHAETSQNI